MHLSHLELLDVRNLESTRLELPGGTLLITGDNGSGKTSLLEAVWLLGTGRSFRSNRMTPVIRYGAASLTVFGEVVREDGRRVALGIQRERSGGTRIKVGGERMQAASALAAELPVQLINPDSVEIVTGPPGRRRQFLDWGTFHVEPSYLEHWKAFRRSLEQRNALLRGGRGSGMEFDLWEARLAQASRAVDEARRASVQGLSPRFDEVLAALGGPEGVSLHYAAGWDPERSLEEQLGRSREADREAGFTRLGPQRADLRIIARGRRASEIISRGQQKLVACALLVAQGHQLESATSKRGVYLVDDLPAELDAEHRYRLGRSLAGMKGQVMVTAVQRDLVLNGLAEAEGLAMFHVKHGRVTLQ